VRAVEVDFMLLIGSAAIGKQKSKIAEVRNQGVALKTTDAEESFVVMTSVSLSCCYTTH